jgi:hypothetical protein
VDFFKTFLRISFLDKIFVRSRISKPKVFETGYLIRMVPLFVFYPRKMSLTFS